MPKEYLTSDYKESRSHSRAVTVRNPSRTIYLCGVTSDDADRRPVTSSFEDAAAAAFDRLRDLVEAAGASLADIVTMTVFITDPRWGDAFVKVRARYWEAGKYPASALITVAGLGRPTIWLEIQAVVVVD